MTDVGDYVLDTSANFSWGGKPSQQQGRNGPRYRGCELRVASSGAHQGTRKLCFGVIDDREGSRVVVLGCITKDHLP